MKNISKVSASVLAAVLLVVFSTVSYADGRGRDHDRRTSSYRNTKSNSYHHKHYSYRYKDHPRSGWSISWIPNTSFSIRLGSARYYYDDGLYYSRLGTQYVLVTPPVGAIVRSIPSDYRPVIVNGVKYYEDRGTYYVYTRYGYQVVAPPVEFITAQVAPSSIMNTTASQMSSAVNDLDNSNEFTVNIKNNKGGYNAVLLKRFNEGFLGPQGEFYSEFPKIAQLKVMYGQ
ncbi:MAG: hypothetical protein H6753_06100 [Candidatus Omnitrophica bacterium]|nr:hypothetical protein [Candidatus Omnitrophota bacterium]